jgi:hypothetical protein
MMWNLTSLKGITVELKEFSIYLRNMVSSNEISEVRLPDFVQLSAILCQPCLPFVEHDVYAYGLNICDSLRRAGERELVILENPLFEDCSQEAALVDLNSSMDVSNFLDEDFLSGAFVIGVPSRSFIWIGNFTDYGFMFTEPQLITSIFGLQPKSLYDSLKDEFISTFPNNAAWKQRFLMLDEIWSKA